MSIKPPKKFFEPLAIGAPAPYREVPVTLERMIHFFPPHVEKMRAKVPEMAKNVDVLLGNLEDAIPADAKEAARAGFVEVAKNADMGGCGLWTRVNCLNSPWFLDDVTEIVAAAGNKVDVIMLPKVEGPWDIHYLDQLLAQLEAKHNVKRPIMIHHPGDGAGRGERGRHRPGVPAHARHEPGPGRPRRLARHEDHPRRRRPSLLRRA